MANIKDKANTYVPPVTKNIADLNKVSVEIEVLHKEATRNDKDKTTFAYDYIVVEGEEYRVPASVLKSLKSILEEIPKLEFFKVKKTGTTKNDTVYTVIPLTGVTTEKIR